MNIKNLFIFASGTIVGGVGVEIIHKVFFKSKENKNVPESDNVCKDNDRKNADQCWTEDDRKRLSEFLLDSQLSEPSNVEFSTKVSSMEASIVASDLIQTVIESKDNIAPSDVVEINNEIDDSWEDCEIINDGIVYVDAIEFVKAVTSGNTMRSIIFDPMSQNFYWNFTDEPLDEHELESFIGHEIMEDIINESNSNVNRSIKPKYLFDPVEKIYSKIETGIIM